MSAVANQLMADVLEAMRGFMRPQEGLLTIGRLLAWHALAERRPPLAKDLLPTFADGLSASLLREKFHGLENCEALGALSHAFGGNLDAPYESLSATALTVLGQRAEALVMLDRDERKVLADAWAAAVLSESPRATLNIPLEVADLVVRSLGLVEGQALHCPGQEMDSVAIAAMRNGFEPFVESRAVPTVAAIYAAITDSKLRYRSSDPLHSDPGSIQFLLGVEACAAVPAWGQRFDSMTRLAKRPSQFGARSSEALGLELATLGSAREVAVVVPNGLLAGRGPDAELRQHLVENGPLKSVIGFPPGVLVGTSMPFAVLRLSKAVATEPIVFCKIDEAKHLSGQGRIRSRDRRFTGADEVLALLERPEPPLARKVPRSEIAAQDFVLTPERYLSASAPLLADMWKCTATLGDLVDIVKPQFMKPDEDPEGVPIQEALPSDLPEFGYLERVDRIRTVDEKLLKARRQQELQKDDVLLSTKGTIGKVGIARPAPARPPLLPSQASVILRVKPGSRAIDPRFLVMYLRAPMVQEAISSFAVGGTIPNISLSVLRSLPVWLPSLEEQRTFIEVFEQQAALEADIAERRKAQASLAQDAWRAHRLVGAE
jgi:hypothetical protein